MRSALITGATGQDGILLAELLINKGYHVWCLVREEAERLSLLVERVPSARILRGDVQDKRSVRRALAAAQPAEIYNLAAFSSVGESWSQIEQVMSINTMGAVNMLEETRLYAQRSDTEPRYYQASSSEMFGSATESPQNEDTPFRPRSPYAVSKLGAHTLTVNYRESYGLFACCGILYNHESTLRPRQFVSRKITSGVAGIERGDIAHIELGNVNVVRDWGYAPDYVLAMWSMLQQDDPDDYVIATGRSRSLTDLLTACFAHIGVDDWRPYVTIRDHLKRPTEVAELVGDATRARRRLGWRPSVSFEQMIAIMVDNDRRATSD